MHSGSLRSKIPRRGPVSGVRFEDEKHRQLARGGNTMLGIVCLDARIVINPLSLAKMVPHPDARGRFRLVASRSLCVSEKTGKVSTSSARGALRALIDRQRERILNDLTGMVGHRRTDVVKFHNYLPLSFDGIGPESDVLFGGRKV